MTIRSKNNTATWHLLYDLERALVSIAAQAKYDAMHRDHDDASRLDAYHEFRELLDVKFTELDAEYQDLRNQLEEK